MTSHFFSCLLVIVAISCGKAPRPAADIDIPAEENPSAMEILTEQMAGDPDENVLEAYLANTAAHPGGSKHGQVFDHGPRQRATLIANRVSLKLPITSCQPLAMPFMNQGFTHMHSFEIIEAERDFRHALYLDKNCIMAIWGAGMANTLFDSGNWARAKKFAQLADALAQTQKTSINHVERTLITELAAFTSHRKQRSAIKRYVSSWINLMKANPEEPELAAFSAHLIWNYDLFQTIGYTKQEVSGWLDNVLKKEPRHPAHHHMIHLWNDSENEEKALDSAALVGSSLMNSAHLWHMGSHIYASLGKIYESDEQFARAAYLDQTQNAALMEFPSVIHNYAHNQDFWIKVLDNRGAQKKAYEMAENLLALPLDRHNNNPKISTSSYMTPFLMGLTTLDQLARSDGRTDLLLKIADKGVLDVNAADIALKKLVALVDFDVAWARLEVFGDRDSRYHELRKKISEMKDPNTMPLLEALDAKEIWMRNGPSEKLVDLWDALEFAESPLFFNKGRIAQYYRMAGAHEKASAQIKNAPSSVANLIENVFAEINTGHLDDAKESFKHVADRAALLDKDHPSFKLGQQLGTRLQILADANADWRKPYTPRKLDLKLPEDFKGTKFIRPHAPDFTATSAKSKQSISLYNELDSSSRGVIVAFVLGGSCTRCNAQLISLEAHRKTIEAAGYKILAITSDSLSDMEMVPTNYMPGFDILSDESMQSFRKYRAYDDFESTPLHGFFVINKNHEIVLLERGSMPYLDLEGLLPELARLSKF